VRWFPQLFEAMTHSRAIPRRTPPTETERGYRAQLTDALETGAALDRRVVWYALGELAEYAVLAPNGADREAADRLIEALRHLR
jgi:hypothetical protein